MTFYAQMYERISSFCKTTKTAYNVIKSMSSLGLLDRNHLLFQQISQELSVKQKALMELDDQMDATINNINDLNIPQFNAEKEKLKTQGIAKIFC